MKRIISICFLVFAISFLKASHNRSGEILYKRIAPFTNVVGGNTVQVYTYSITVVKYTDHGAGIADRCVDTVYFGDGTSDIVPRSNGTSSCNCGTYNGNSINCGSIIFNNVGYIVKQNIYTVVHTYPGPGVYVISSSDPGRNHGIHNIPNSANVPFYLESLIVINSFSGSNSSPTFSFPLPLEANLGVLFSYNMGATDIDGDSLSYELTSCRGQNGQPIIAYFYPEADIIFSIDPTSGILTWNAPKFLGQYNIAVLTKEWRKNTSGVYEVVGFVLRDMQILVKIGVVGLAENSFENALKIYPTPFNDNLVLDFGLKKHKKLEISIFGNDGRLVFNAQNENIEGELNLSVSDLKVGVYILRVTTEEGVSYKKLIKQ